MFEKGAFVVRSAGMKKAANSGGQTRLDYSIG